MTPELIKKKHYALKFKKNIYYYFFIIILFIHFFLTLITENNSCSFADPVT